MPIFLLGAQLFAGTAYLASVLVAALLTDHSLAWKLALVSQGLSYLCVSAQVMVPSKLVAAVLWLLTLLVGAAAGITLLF